MIIKPNKVGTITGMKETAFFTLSSGMKIVLSYRSGETPDDSITHRAVAWNILIAKNGRQKGREAYQAE